MKYKIGDIFHNNGNVSHLTIIDVSNDRLTGCMYYLQGYKTGKSIWLQDYELDNYIISGRLVLATDYITPIRHINKLKMIEYSWN